MAMKFYFYVSDLRVGFNSLGGYASVNHQHFHAYYLSYRLMIEYMVNIPCIFIALMC